MNNNIIFVDYHKCVGCGTCEMVCSLVHEDYCSPAASRIRIVRNEKEGRNVPITCAFCEKPLCLNVCPVGAISRSRETGEVLVQESKCIGCRQCASACPFGHMNFNFQKGMAFKCDLCQGDPQCVKFCWTGAVTYVPLSMALDAKRRQVADKVLEETGVNLQNKSI